MYQVSLDKHAAQLIATWGFVPERLTRVLVTRDQFQLQVVLLTAVTAQFMHVGWIHVIGNLVYLRAFGDHVECDIGPIAYPTFFLTAGLVGLGAQYAFDPTSTLAIVGASGAIAGVLGLYIVLFPTARIVTLFPVLIFLTFVEVPAALFLGVWAAQQLLNGLLALGGEVDAIAWFAHLGGFAYGVIIGLLTRLTRYLRLGRSFRAASSSI